MRTGDHLLPARQIVVAEAKITEVTQQHFRVEDAHHDLFAEGRGHGRYPQLNFCAIGRERLDTAILWSPLLDNFHPGEQFDATDHRSQYRLWNLVDLMQYAVDTEANNAGISTWFNVNITRALFKRVLPQPVNDADNVAVIGVRRCATGLHANLDQLFKRRDGTLVVRCLLLRTAHRLRQCEELGNVALDVERVGKHQFNPAAQQLRQLGNPRAHERLTGGHGHHFRRHRHRQDAIAVGVARAHD
ncbi:MAG: hypothetical protein BWZ07_02873 [Alphaproteobacteria bacterium ADurb.BinA280]|nr:MAG: hypothetical protein BWZ07_02873 [Alphaproteobacteria bacterium ADurb.BinA280]